MSLSRWERWAPATGVVFVVLFIIAFFLGGQPPKPNDPIAKITTFIVDHRRKLQATAYLGGIGTIFFFWFLGSFRDVLAKAEGGTGRLTSILFSSGVIIVGIATLSLGMLATMAFKPAITGDGGVRVLFDLGNMSFAMVQFPMVAFLLAASILMIRTGAISRRLGWLGLLNAVIQLIVAGALFPDHGALAAGGAFNTAGFFLFFLWMLAASIIMTAQAGTAAPAS